MYKNKSRLFIFICTVLFICTLGFHSTASAACTDIDGDGYGYPGDASCPKGSQTDCDDNDNKVYPGAAEICDGKDSNCDGWKPATDVDKDGDGVPMCKNDCNDNNNTVYPGAPELCDGIDNNCDYIIPINERDVDGDGYRTCGIPADCNDNDRFINPGAQEWCSDNKDNNCNSQIDETPCICPDADSDGFTASYCGGTDCTDTDNTIYPGAPELCTDGKDNDCNGLKDCADPNAVNCPAITDTDGDGFDVAGICGTPDCDDNDPKVYPGAAEICDGKDSNCDGWKAPTDRDADGDGVPLCASDCDDNDPNRFPGNIEHALRNTCNDFIDNDCDNLTDAGDPDCIGSCQTAANPKEGPHFVTLLNTDNTVHADNSALSCGKCHAANFQDPVRYECQRCHADPADTSDPRNGTLKAQYPLNAPYGFGSAPNVSSHTTWTLGDQGCVTCHNPHTQEQNNLFGTTYGKYIKEYICYDSKGIQQFVEFTSNTGPGSFADGAPYGANICNTCHTTTNHQQNDGTAPGGQDHNNGQDCMQCHSHSGGFAPIGGTPAAPHNTDAFSNNCDYCHVSATDYSSPVPDAKCAQCHTPSGTLKGSFPSAPDVLTHQAKACVGCHQLMTAPGNLKLVKKNLSAIGGGTNVVFTALTGAGSFADGPPYTENVCNTCHTATNHQQNDGTAPGGQDHNNGADCTACHPHAQAFTPILPDPVAPHNTAAFLNDCSLCHVSSTDFTSTIPDTKCQQCHSPAGVFKGSFPAAPDVATHQGRACVGCHEPMFGTTNIAHVRTDLTAVGGGSNITFTAYTGTGSFADGPPYTENVCNTCHTATNHQQNDGTAPGGQDHHNGQDCGLCHSHLNEFQPVADVPPPHDTFDCTVCHVTPDTYVVDAAIPNSACNGCHGDGNPVSGPDVSTHNGSHYGSFSLDCVECHNPMSAQTNLAFIRSTIRNKSVVFTAYTGANSFADGGAPYNGICEVCHTQTNHHQNDGSAPGGQDHNNGTDCTLCHDHKDGLQPSGSCLGCHSTQQGNRAAVAGQFSGNSHHVQGVQMTNAICYQCHWEADSDGSINNSYHEGWNAPGSPVNLVIYGSGTRPSAYSLGTTAVAYTAIAGAVNIPIAVGNDSAGWPYSGTNQSTANRVYIDYTNPANADGVIDTFNLYVTQGSGTIWIFTASKSGSTVTPRSVATVSLQGTNRTNTWTGLNLTVKAGDVVGFYGSTLRVRQASSGTGSVAYSSSAVTPTPGVPITASSTSTGRLAVYATGASTVSSGTISRTELLKINQHCLGCHSAQNSTVQPFGDGKTPKQYAWDGRSIAERYSQTGTTPWGKYTDTSTTDITPKNTQTKAYSAHGNAAANQRGWDLNETWPNTSGTENVLCFDCHNSHGSTVGGETASYTSVTANGAILKDTTAGLGGYTMSYKPQAGGSVPENDAYNEGAGLCFDCHMTQNSGAKPWGYQNTFGSTQGVLGYFDTLYFAPGLSGPQQRYTYKASDGLYKAGHLGASAPLSTAVTGTIGGLCTPCHDPHGVSPSLGTSQQYAVPLLKGTWLTSPYKEDTAPGATNEQRGCSGEKCRNSRFSNSSTPGYHIDQNTFANWSYTSTASVSQSVNEFGGLCLQCHPKTSLSPDTNSSWNSVDRIHNSVKGWDNDGSTMHRYTCSKCHSPHTSTLGRLLITNCLDAPHRGQVATGATVPPNQSGNGEEGSGSGRFPAGGGGSTGKNDGRSSLQGPFFFGTSSGGRACHDNENSSSYPDNQLWNTVSPWGDFGGGGGSTCSSYSSRYSCESNNNCRWSDNQCRNR